MAHKLLSCLPKNKTLATSLKIKWNRLKFELLKLKDMPIAILSGIVYAAMQNPNFAEVKETQTQNNVALM
jgi:hypothetical protein